MRKLLTLFLISFIIFPLTTYAGIYGTLKGKVVDEEGKPVIGATVRVMGTPRGTYVKEKDGKFTIVNISSGEYQVQVTAVGFTKYNITVRISADEITDINVKLKSERIQTGEVNVIGAKEMVNNTEIGTKRKITSEQATHVAREGIASVVGLNAGVIQGGNGYNIRGSRESESQIRIEGIDVGSQFTGGFGASGLGYFPMISAFATEEVQVITGSFSAEYGNALGGIVNTVPKVGRDDKFEGFIRWRTDVDALWGSQASDLILRDDGIKLTAIHTGAGHKLQGPKQHKFEFGVGGPIPVLNNSTFYLSGNYLFEKYRGASFEIYDPVDLNKPSKPQNNLGQLPNQRSWVKNLTFKSKWGISNDIYLILGGMWGLTNLEGSSWGWLYANDVGVINGTSNGVPERIAKQMVYNTLVRNIYAKINHQLDNKSFYEITVSNNYNGDEISKRNLYPDYSVLDIYGGRISADAIKNPVLDPSFFGGFNVWYPVDDIEVSGDQFVKGKDKLIDAFQNLPAKKGFKTADGYLTMASRAINPITGYIEGDDNSSGTSNPFGRDNAFVTHGNGGMEFRSSVYWEIDGNYSLSMETGEFSHMFKTGVDLKFYELRRHSNQLPFSLDPFFDVYTDQWGGNIYANNDTVWQKTSKPYKPITGAVYVQDQISYKGIIISPGLRFDFFKANTPYRTNLGKFTSILDNTGFSESPLKYQVSPRINVAYPITERSNVSINYGLNFKMPELQYLFDGYGVERVRGNAILGNPDLAAQRENSYQVAYNNQLSDDFAFDITAYYKDIYNQVGLSYVTALPQPYFIYTIAEYGNARGLEIQLRKRPTAADHIGFELNYNLSSVIGTSASVFDNYLAAPDPYTGTQIFPLYEYPMPWDRRHVINFNLTFNWGDNQGPSIAGIQPLENTNLSLTTIFRSGAPYTKFDIKGKQIGELNGERGPIYWNTDARLTKQFFFRDFFGEGAGNTSIEFFVDVYNIFNRTGPSSFYIITGDPDDDGSAFYITKGAFSDEPLFRYADFADPRSMRASQYDDFGNRKYNINADFDNNNVVTQEEKFEAYKRQLEVSRKFQGTYFTPIRVYFGVMFRF